MRPEHVRDICAIERAAWHLCVRDAGRAELHAGVRSRLLLQPAHSGMSIRRQAAALASNADSELVGESDVQPRSMHCFSASQWADGDVWFYPAARSVLRRDVRRWLQSGRRPAFVFRWWVDEHACL